MGKGDKPIFELRVLKEGRRKGMKSDGSSIILSYIGEGRGGGGASA